MKDSPHIFTWSTQAESAFQRLKEAFTSAPILKHPDPSVSFEVEIDTSETGVGAVLSQRTGNPPKLNPIAFYSHKLTSAEHNFGIGDHELLAVN